MVGSYWFLALMIIACVGAAVGGLRLVRSRVKHHTLTVHHEVAGYMLSIVGTLYAVVLGLMVVNSLNTFQQARITVMHEANSLHDIFHTAHGLSAKEGTEIRQECLQYALAMTEDEWSTMKNGLPSDRGRDQTTRLWRATVDFKPKLAAEENLQQAMITQMDELSDCRQTRLTGAQPTFDYFIWTVLIVGGVVLVVFTYFFGVEKLAVQIVMTALVTLSLSLNMVLIVMFGYPYSGDVRVSPQPFESDIKDFQRELSGK
jgi:hypothetical protein